MVVAGLHVAVEGPFGRARLDAGTLRRIAAEVAERGASLSVGVASDAGVQAVIDALEPLRAGGRAPPVRRRRSGPTLDGRGRAMAGGGGGGAGAGVGGNICPPCAQVRIPYSCIPVDILEFCLVS